MLSPDVSGIVASATLWPIMVFKHFNDRATGRVANTLPGRWGTNKREASPHFDIDPTTKEKTCSCVVPPLDLHGSPASAATAFPGSGACSEPPSPTVSEVPDAEGRGVSLFKAVEAWETEGCAGGACAGGPGTKPQGSSAGGVDLGSPHSCAFGAESADPEAHRQHGRGRKSTPSMSRWTAPTPDPPTVGELLARSRREAEAMRAHAQEVLALFEALPSAARDEKAPNPPPSTTRLRAPGWHAREAVRRLLV